MYSTRWPKWMAPLAYGNAEVTRIRRVTVLFFEVVLTQCVIVRDWKCGSAVLVPGTGLEPVRPFHGKRRILSPLCLPISPPGQMDKKLGGGGRNRTGVHGVAVRCMTTLPPRQGYSAKKWRAKKRGSVTLPLRNLERETRLELATYTLARYRSTN